MTIISYALHHMHAQEFVGYDTPGELLRAVADFSDETASGVYTVSLRWTPDGNYGATVTWEDEDAES